MKATRKFRTPADGRALVIPSEVSARALSRVEILPDGCHLSTYSVGSHGYAQIGWERKDCGRRGTTAHRAAWTAVNGQIPLGMTIDHLCRTRRCVNPEHLRMLSNVDNARDNSQADKWVAGLGPRQGRPAVIAGDA